MKDFLAIVTIILGFLGGVACLFDWFDAITRLQLRRNEVGRTSALKMIDKAEAHFNKHLDKPGGVGDYYKMSSFYGVFISQRVTASAYDKLHQATRRSHGLDFFSLQETTGLLSRYRVAESHNEIARKIAWQRENFEQQDLRPLALKLMVAALVTGIAAIYV